jgi:CDP-diacylglycerol pyrophosphatase
MRRWQIQVLAAALAGLAGCVVAPPAWADSDALWKIVHGRCVPDQEAHGKPSPCARVDEQAGYAVLKDNNPKSPYQFLLIPTAKITGIDDPEVLAPATPNYFALAWDNRHFLADRLKAALPREGVALPREAVALAINSAYGRSQNQLHIHIDCVRADVAAALQAHQSEIGESWADLATPLVGHSYRVRRVVAENLNGINPFRLVAEQGPETLKDMAGQTIVVVGARFDGGKDGFYLLDDQASVLTLDHASGEELQDHTCQIVRR